MRPAGLAAKTAGLKAAIREVLPEAAWQRCYVHFLSNTLDYVPRKVDDDCLQELRWFYDRRELAEVRRDIAACSYGVTILQNLTHITLPARRRKS